MPDVEAKIRTKMMMVCIYYLVNLIRMVILDLVTVIAFLSFWIN